MLAHEEQSKSQEDEAREIVAALYPAVLKRPADDGGLNSYAALLLGHGGHRGVAAAVSSMLASQEYRLLAVQHLNGILDFLSSLSVPKQLIANCEVKHVVPLGTNCLTAAVLKSNGLKRYSTPFDWLFSSPGAVLHCLRDDFSTFLDASHYRSIPRPEGERGAEHLWFVENFNVTQMFAHRDPTEPVHYAYFERCVQRFRDVCASEDGKIFWMLSEAKHDAVELFAQLSDALGQITRNSTFICVQLTTPTWDDVCSSMVQVQANGRDRCYRYTPSSRNNGVNFENRQ
ncbi:MAG TPA: DUF1796 family putative cysteine peptidase, partial [Bosea sp. (in: a-proteobacteria)]|nr:DUF1796 family putative cysteine peptidase [Bosea sp. (in: a-proteobacteria)]